MSEVINLIETALGVMLGVIFGNFFPTFIKSIYRFFMDEEVREERRKRKYWRDALYYMAKDFPTEKPNQEKE